ncbi:PLD nuclease N-terminal domain-containing protein [Ectopseudomonas mendocina]|uniref:Cardiolipin synthase N-terminal domain-containing protein n=1 Tax=Ectopseudomonas mendocina TaxID=300 RepID=A0A2R3QV43_ECTME|nr:PLD nuclease N-terminal domain-containing protein [Pseudomonas mendocina]AVO55594.1 hypothetical protein C7A17_23500 [Pseudomonas mendocina]
MSDFLIYSAMAVAAIIILIELWAIISVFRSDEPIATKTLWALFIWIVPLIGIIAWVIAGPRGHGKGPSSPEHSK